MRLAIMLLMVFLPLGLLGIGVVCIVAALGRRHVGRPLTSALVGAAIALGAAVLAELLGLALVGALID